MAKVERLRVYLKIGTMYCSLATAWRGSTEHKGTRQDTIMFRWITDRLLTGFGIKSSHISYPETGDIHLTYTLEDGKKVHVSAERVTMSWMRDRDLNELPKLETLQWMTEVFGRKNPPPFSKIDPSARVIMVSSGVPIPHPSPGLLGGVATPKAGAEVIDLAGMEGTLNIHPFVAGIRTPAFEFDPAPIFHRVFSRGVEPPFYGFSVALLPYPEPDSGRKMHQNPRSNMIAGLVYRLRARRGRVEDNPFGT
jgi:hypothetical protein